MTEQSTPGQEPDKWYYAFQNQQKGPVSAAALTTLFASGAIGQNTLVWREGMDGWKPYSSVASDVQAAAERAGGVPASGLVTCAYSGEVHPKSEMLQYGDQWVMAQHKDAFVRALEQGRQVGGGAVVTSMAYVGFWWRVLSKIIDGIVTTTLSFLALLPLIIVGWGVIAQLMSNPGGFEFDQIGGGSITAMIIAAIVSFILLLVVNIGYYTYMVGKYQATLGKMALGFIVVNADGSRVGYAKALGRFFAEVLHSIVGSILGALIGAAITFGMLGMSGGDQNSPAFIFGQVISVIPQVIGGYIGYFWAGWTKQKTAIHDLICSTRVVRK